MFFIVNKTKQHITLGDISVTLGPKQAIDLDRVMERPLSDKSRHLKAAVSRGNIEVRVKDGEKPKHPSKIVEAPTNAIDKMKKDIIKEMKGTMKELMSEKSDNSGISKADLNEALSKFVQLLPQSTKETVIIKGEEPQDEKVDMDEETLAAISARVVEDRAKDAKLKTVHYKEEQQKESILDNVDELENLLG